MKFIPYILSLSMSAGFMFEVLLISAEPAGRTVQTCLGQTIILDLNQDNPPYPPAHKLKPCHAICCSEDGDADAEGETA